MVKVGTAQWAHKNQGILTRAEYLSLHFQLLRLQLKEFQAWLAKKGVVGKPPLLTNIESVTFPDSAIAKQADELVRDVSSEALHLHCVRTYVWGVMLGKHAGLKFDPELFYVASLLHDLGLVEPHIKKTDCACFAVTGAHQAKSFVLAHGWAPEKADRVFETISLHLNLDVRSSEFFAEAQMLAHGAHLDVVGAHYNRLSPFTVDSVLSRYPRTGFVEEISSHIDTPHNRMSRAEMLGSLGFSKRAHANPLNRH